MLLTFNRIVALRISVARFSTMPRKRASVAIDSVAPSTNVPPITVTPPKRNTSQPTKRKASNPPKTPTKRVASHSVLEAPEDRAASPDEGESQNTDLDDGDQATQARLPAVNSDILPLPWKGRLGYA
jgi:hypothetical protein